MVKRSLLRAIASVIVGALLLAQLAVAAYACPGLIQGAVTDFQAAPTNMSAAAVAEQSANSMVNCGDMGGAIDESAPNLCSEHCRYGQQSDHTSTLTLPAVLLIALYALSPVPETVSQPLHAAFSLSAMASVDPPHAILHCCLRT